MAELLFSHLLLAEEPTAMTSHPVLAVDETEGSEVPTSREEDGGSRDSNLPSPPPDTSKY